MVWVDELEDQQQYRLIAVRGDVLEINKTPCSDVTWATLQEQTMIALACAG
jgi:hypothetical protein